SLDELLPLLDTATVERAVKIGACNIYHGCVHNMLHEKSEDALKGLYKAASFVVQAVALRQTGKYVKQKRDLLNVVSSDEKIIVENLLRIKDGCDFDFDNMSETLFSWSKKIISDTM
ncbi:MAG: nucleotidyltransferase domain-containing protein, partial [Clostridia bacterium]|nr:nucleotidyltransferase domain-containing protein [Clostridia bacterium]